MSGSFSSFAAHGAVSGTVRKKLGVAPRMRTESSRGMSDRTEAAMNPSASMTVAMFEWTRGRHVGYFRHPGSSACWLEVTLNSY